MSAKTYYHVIEEASGGNIGCHGCYTDFEEARKEEKRLTELFGRPSLYFWIYESASEEEPPICTV